MSTIERSITQIYIITGWNNLIGRYETIGFAKKEQEAIAICEVINNNTGYNLKHGYNTYSGARYYETNKINIYD